MATKNKTIFLCSDCGYTSTKWSGKCPSCGAWNTMDETKFTEEEPSSTGKKTEALAERKTRLCPFLNWICLPTCGQRREQRSLTGCLAAGSCRGRWCFLRENRV